MNFPKEPLKPIKPSLRQSDSRTSSFAAAQMGAMAGSTLPGDRRGAQPWGGGVRSPDGARETGACKANVNSAKWKCSLPAL